MSINPTQPLQTSMQVTDRTEQSPPVELSGEISIHAYRVHFVPLEEDHLVVAFFGDFEDIVEGDERYVLCYRVAMRNPEFPESADWHMDGHPSLSGVSFPIMIPCSYFYGKRDGETVTIRSPENNIVLNLTCKLKEPGYSSFEELAEEMFMVTYNTLSGTSNRTTEQEEQFQILARLKQEYFPASTSTSRGMVWYYTQEFGRVGRRQ